MNPRAAASTSLTETPGRAVAMARVWACRTTVYIFSRAVSTPRAGGPTGGQDLPRQAAGERAGPPPQTARHDGRPAPRARGGCGGRRRGAAPAPDEGGKAHPAPAG